MNEQLQKLDGLYQTTRAEKAITSAREVQALIDDGVLTEQSDVENFIEEVNKGWPHRFDAMRLCGKAAIFCDSDTYDAEGVFVPSEDEIIEKMFSDLPVTSHGFTYIERPIYIEGEQIATRREIVYKVALENEEGEWIDGYGDIEHSVLVPMETHNDRRIAEARHFLPDETMEIDMAVLNADNESQAVKALRRLRFMSPPPQSLDGMTQEEYTDSLAAYANQLVIFDDRVPYRCTIEGKCRLYLEGDEVLDIKHVPRERRLLYPKFLTVESLTDDEVAFYLTATVLFNDKTENTVKFPLTSLYGMVSLRQQELGRIANGAI